MGSNPPIDVLLKLISSKCFPILMYGLAAVSTKPNELGKLSFAYNSIFCKLFNVKTKSEIKFCQYFCNYWEFPHLQNYYRFCFLKKLFVMGQLSSTCLMDAPDLNELYSLSKHYNLHYTDSSFSAKKKIWKYIEENISLL